VSTRDDEVVDAIWEHWIVHRDLPVDLANDMRDELAQHLDEAADDGKSTADVTGPDLLAFADGWAEQAHQKRRFEPFRLAIQAVVSGAAGLTFAHVAWTRTLDVSPRWVDLGLASLSVVAFALVFFGPWGSRLGHRPEPHPKLSKALVAGLAGGAVFIVFTGLSTLIGSDASITMPRVIVAIMALAGGLIFFALPLTAISANPLTLLTKVLDRLGRSS